MLCCFSVSAKPRNHVFRILTLVKFMLELEVSHLLSRTAHMFALPCCDCRSVCVCFSDVFFIVVKVQIFHLL